MNRDMIVLMMLAASAWVGCGESVGQSGTCAAYVQCVEAMDARDGVDTDVDRFEVSGACWGSEEGATLCDRACTNGLDYIRQRDPQLPQECRS